MRVALLGFDTEGRASFEYFRNRGDDITICDIKTDVEVPDGVARQLGDGYLDNLDQFDLLVRTAGMPPEVILAANPEVGAKITSATNEFFKASPTKHIIGITGTKGKGTTSTLIYEMLKAAGRPAYLGGNIGLPPLSFLSELTDESWVVLELSSFQLVDLQQSPRIAVCLMVVAEHLNWHNTLVDYVKAKTQLFAHQTTDDVAIYFAESDLSEQIASAGDGVKIPYFAAPGAVVHDGALAIDGQEVVRTDEIKLLGAHNLQNAAAAVTAAWQAGVRDRQVMRQVLATFSGLEHRLEFVRELDGVKYYDDSFGTTPETAIVALQAFTAPKVVILGGSDKGSAYEELAKVVADSNVRHALMIGDQGGKIQGAIGAAGFTDFSNGGETMAEIVTNAQAQAQAGDVVLLSPACASFDMFKSYKDRGDQFKAAVQALTARGQ